MNRRSFHTLAVLLAALTAAGCAQSNGDLVQVQPNVVRKSDLLDGVWYFRNTVTWTPFNTQFTFPGQTGNMEKLVWEIQQGNLIGYRSYPYVLGAEPNVDQTSKVSGTTAKYCDADGKCAGGQKYYGAPVVAFPITSHFDIQRGYNPATGEATNVISENTSDRPWNEREYIRVNWAANILNQASGMNWGTVQNANDPMKTSNANWIQANEAGSDPFNWPTFEYTDRDGDGKKELTYFDVTGRYLANPDTEYYDFGDGTGITVPLCYFAPGIYECASSEIHVRISVAKVDTARSQDYEPLVYGNDLMAYFGYFRTERLNYDRKFGFTESARVLLANRHRMYKEYYTKENGKVTSTPIPMAQRELQPIVYYFTPANRMGGQDRYDEFWEPGRIIERDFDRAFRRAAAAARGATTADKANWQAQPQMFYLCNNPVKQGDPAACGQPGFAPKIGDLRYSFVNTVAEPVANGLLGYGPSSADPETGEILSAMSNTYTWGVDMYGAQVKNWVLLQSGELTINDYLSGQMVKDYISANPAYNVRNRSGPLKAELQSVATRNEESKGAFDRPTERMKGVLNKVLADRTTIAANGMVQKAAKELQKHPELEAAILDNPDVADDVLNLLPPPLQAALRGDPQRIRAASRKILADPSTAGDWEKRRIEYLTKNSITTFDFYDRTLVGYATKLIDQRINRVTELTQNQGLSEVEAKRIADEEIMKYVRQQVWLGTSLHEAGHTLNLRHNFQGSFDSINYFDAYWDLRRDTLTVDQNGVAKIARTPADMKAVAESNQISLLQGLHDGEYSSIMDYSGKIFGDWLGLGKYDEAAIIFAYSGGSEPGYVEVFDNARTLSQVFPGSDGANVTVSGAREDLALVNVQHTNPNIRNYTERFHYSLVPLHFGEGSDVISTMNDGIAKMRTRHLEKWSDVVASEAVVRNALIADPTLIEDPDRAAGVIGNAILRVPYMFCTDESADGPVLSCNRFDRGPDYYEMVHTKLEDYWNYYVDNHFRRDRVSFSGSGAIYGTLSTFNLAASSYRHWVYEFYKKAAADQEQGTYFKFDQNFQDYWTMAVIDGVNQNLNVMAVPEDGYFRLYSLPSGPTWLRYTSGIDYDYPTPQGMERIKANVSGTDWVLVPRGLGRRMYNQYDYRSGYNYQRRINEAGHYNDQIGAMFAAVLSDIDVQGVDVTADLNRYSIPYYLVFRDEMQSTFSAMWANDDAKIRPRIYRKALPTYPLGGVLNNGVSEDVAIDYKTFVRGTDFFAGFNYPRELGNCGPTQHPYRDNCLKGEQKAAPAFVFASSTAAFYSLYFGMAMFKVNYDLDYAKANQIFKLGSGESFTVAPGYEVVEVPDIFTGHRYAAVKKIGSPKDSTGAERMINLTNDYLQMVQNPATCPVPEYFQLLGYDCMDPAQANNPSKIEEERQYWKEAFQNQVGYLDLQRSFYTYFGKAL